MCKSFRGSTCIVRVKQVFNGHPVYFFKLEKDMKMFDLYKYIVDNITNAHIQLSSGMIIPDPGSSSAPWAAMAEGIFYPEKTAPHKFIIIHDEDCLFYFSEKPLSGDIEKDKPYLYANMPYWETRWNVEQKTNYLNLTKGKRYYFRFIVKNMAGAGSGKIGYIHDQNDTVKTIDEKMIRFMNARDDDVDTNLFMPQIENDPTLGHYAEPRKFRYDSSRFTITGNYKPLTNGVNISQLLTDFDYSNQQTGVAAPLPIVYNIDFGEEIELDSFYLPVPNKKMNGNISITCDSKIIYEGLFDTKTKNTVEFDSLHKCKTANISVLSNTYGNKSYFVEIQPMIANAGSTDNIIPATHTKFKIKGDGKLSNEGIYYNGKGWHLKEEASLTANIHLNSTGDSIVIIGDRHLNYGGGILEVYLDCKLHGTVNTSFVFPDDAKTMSTNEYYQSPLYYIHDLKPNSNHILSLVTRAGQVEISGLLANGNLNEVPPDPIHPAHPENPVDGKGPDSTDGTKPEANPTTVSTKDALKDRESNPDDKSKTGLIVGVVVGIIAACIIAAVIVFVIYKRKQQANSDTSVGSEVYNV